MQADLNPDNLHMLEDTILFDMALNPESTSHNIKAADDILNVFVIFVFFPEKKKTFHVNCLVDNSHEISTYFHYKMKKKRM